jgi:hypothetical protein
MLILKFRLLYGVVPHLILQLSLSSFKMPYNLFTYTILQLLYCGFPPKWGSIAATDPHSSIVQIEAPVRAFTHQKAPPCPENRPGIYPMHLPKNRQLLNFGKFRPVNPTLNEAFKVKPIV